MAIPRDRPENHGLSSHALLEFFGRIEDLGLAVGGLMLLQNGKATAEYSQEPHRKECEKVLFSLSKSFTSIAVGIAWDQGYLHLDDKVVSYFPDKLPDPVPAHLEMMTIHHLLSMNTGHHHNIYEAVIKEQDWAKAFLSLEVEHEPGTFYRYSTHATYMLSAILQQATGEGLVDFLMPRLFEPLDIPRPSWETCPMGIAAGGMGLSLSAESVAKFGLMLLGKGAFEGRRIVSERYIELAIAEHSDNRTDSAPIDSAQGYGYQFHRCRKGCYRGDGAFGQLCFIAPQHNIVIVANCSFPNMKPLHVLLDLIYEHIIDQLGRSVSFSETAYKELQWQLTEWSSSTNPVQTVQSVSGYIPDWMEGRRRYMMEDNPDGVRQMAFELMNNGQLELELLYGDERDQLLSFDFAKPVQTKAFFWKDLSMHEQKAVTYAMWKDHCILQLTLYYIETPYVVDYIISLEEASIDVQFKINASMHLSPFRMRGNLK